MTHEKMTFEEQLDFYPYGTQYHRAPTPLPEEWAGDLAEIKRVGFTHVQFRPQWRWHERIRGKATWDDLDRLFDLARENGLRVVLKPMLETAPDWVFTELGGTRIGFHGAPITPFAHGAYYVGGWWPCFDNPEVIASASDFVRRLVERYRSHPALWMYDAWNEPVSRPTGQCQCEHAVASYRQWLQRRFGPIERLNEFFGKAWTSYDTLFPPTVWEDYVELFLWRQWAAESVASQVKFVADAIRLADPKAFVMVHVGQSSVTQDPVWATSDDMLNAKTTDRYGTSFWIPLHPKTPIDHAHPDYQSDWIRRVDPSYWCHEFYTNHGEWSRPPEPRTLNRLIWFAIAGGAAGFTFWQYRSERLGNETNGYGMRNIDGSPTDRSQVTDGIARTLAKFGKSLVGTKRVPSQIGLLYSRESDLIMRIQESNSSWGEGGLAQERGNSDYTYKKAIKAAHALYLGCGQTVDWCVPGDDLASVRLLHVTCTEMIDAKTAQWLKDFVQNGGTLVVEFPFACRDERTWVTQAIPSHGLDGLLGCTQADRVVTVKNAPDVATFTNGRRIQADRWRIVLAPTTGKPLAHWQDGSVAAVVNKFGKGTVYAVGANVSAAFSDSWDDPAFDLFSEWVRSAGVETGSGASRHVWVRKRRAPGREVWFVFNVSTQPQKITLHAVPKHVWQDAGCALSKSDLLLEPGATWVAEFAV